MATSRISNTILDPTGTAIASVPVTVTLMPSAGFREDTFTEVARIATTTSNGSGFWQLDLERNSNITPSNSWYEVVELVPAADGGKRVWYIAVGDSDQTLLASLVTPSEQQPTVVPAGTVYLSQAAADARYQALGSLGDDTPVTIQPDDAGTAGVSTSASRDDHEHPIATAAPTTVDLDGTGSASEGVATSFSRSDHKHVAENDAWTAWTPTLSNLTLGSGTLEAVYQRSGRTVHYRFRFVLGSGSAVGTSPEFTLPFAPSASYNGAQSWMGVAVLSDTGTATHIGYLQHATGGARINHQAISGTTLLRGTVTSTAPFTWASGDVIECDGFYEAAS